MTFTVNAAIASSATGSITNTASLAVPGSVIDTNPVTSASDTDTLTPQADLAITKTDGVASASPGGTTTYTIVATNNGPSDVVGATVTDVMPAAVTGDTFTAVGTGGAAGFSPSGSGNLNETIDLPAGATVTYTVVADIASGASGDLVNTATIAAPAGVTDTNRRQQQRDRHRHADRAGGACRGQDRRQRKLHAGRHRDVHRHRYRHRRERCRRRHGQRRSARRRDAHGERVLRRQRCVGLRHADRKHR